MKTDQLLIKLIEECAEVTKECTKILTFGFDSYHPDDKDMTTNRTKLELELGDLMGVMNGLIHNGELNIDTIKRSEASKLKRMEYWNKKNNNHK